MPSSLTDKNHAILLKLISRLSELEILEQWIPNNGGPLNHVYAEWHADGRLIVNPMPHVVDSVLHELCHEVFPEFTEMGVRSLVGKLMKGISEEDIQMIYAEYRRRVDEG